MDLKDESLQYIRDNKGWTDAMEENDLDTDWCSEDFDDEEEIFRAL